MRLRVLGLAAVLVLLPLGVRAQIVRRGPQPNVRALDAATIDKLVPLLQGQSTAGDNSLDAKLAARGMNKQEFVANKNALMIARQDDLNPGRLTAIKEDLGAFQARQANARLYRANKARLEALLSKLEPDPGCDLCSGPNIPPKQTQSH